MILRSLPLLLCAATVAAQSAQRLEARRLRNEALDQRAALDLDSTVALLDASRRADPTYVLAHFEYMQLRLDRFEARELRRESAVLLRSPDPIQQCIGMRMANLIAHRDGVKQMLAVARSGQATICAGLALVIAHTIPGFTDADRLTFFPALLRDLPEFADLYSLKASYLMRERRYTEATRVLSEGLRFATNALTRTGLTMGLINVRVLSGDTVGAVSLERSLRAAIDRDGRPGLRAVFETSVCSQRVWSDPAGDQSQRTRAVFARGRVKGDWSLVIARQIDCGRVLIDRGDNAEALRRVTAAIPLADSVRSPDLWLWLYTTRARALWHMGRWQEAERDQRRALSLGADAAKLYNVADAYHNLGHVYEGQGRWRDANRAIDRYVDIARPMYANLRFSSLLDAGEMRWKAGWHASARVAFEDMVRVGEELNENFVYAGEYYERIGDLQRARDYHRKARAEGAGAGNTAALSGLVRVYEQLGMLDSAEAIARVHDSEEAIWTPLEMPLMPAILARRGKSAEALGTARAYAERVEQRGNVQGASLAYAMHAGLALDARQPREALVTATRAESLAATMRLKRERVRAATLRGRALLALGARDSALATLRVAARLAGSDSSTSALLEANIALGDALASAHDVDGALAAFDVAARSAEHVTSSFMEDLDRARYRDRNLLPFDGAMRVLLGADSGVARVSQVVSWSARRKAAALALSTNRASPVMMTRASLTDLQRRLGASTALIDYVVLDSAVAAVVVTRERASIIRLAVTKDSLANLVNKLRRPLVSLYGGRLDLARAPFDLGVSAVLHLSLIKPLSASLTGVRRLVIVPDAALHALPFEALASAAPAQARAPDYAGASYLIDAFEVEYLPSSAFLSVNGGRAGVAAGRLLVVGYDAPGAAEEARALRSSWPTGRSVTLEDHAANERAVKTSVASFDVVHFVVHAEASARDPLASHLRFAPDSLEDGYLNVDEIAALRLRARLVVLSACETDAGPVFNGEGVIGLARAFLAGGANAVIGTQWPVGPATATLMQHFYSRLAAGDSPAAALRVAKLALRRDPDTAHPALWAAAVLVTGGGRR